MTEYKSKQIDKAIKLLEKDEDHLPENVIKTITYLCNEKIWFLLSRNKPVITCPQAARERKRLGYRGVPLWEELKTYFAEYRGSKGECRFVMIHCRGNQRRDGGKITKQLSSTFQQVESEELRDIFGMKSGTVNPFTVDTGRSRIPVLHLFDESLLHQVSHANTMFTNAGEITWAVEFNISDLARTFRNKKIGDYVEGEKQTYLNRMPKIGIITGSGPESGRALWQSMEKYIRTFSGEEEYKKLKLYGDLGMPEIYLISLPLLGLVMELSERHELIWRELQKSVETMCREGITILSIASHTAQYFAEKISTICDRYDVAYIYPEKDAQDHLKRKNIHKFLLLGNEFVCDTDSIWSPYGKAFSGFDVVLPSEKQIKQIREIALIVKDEGPNNPALNRFRDVMARCPYSENVVIAITEISLLLYRHKKAEVFAQRNFVDLLDMQAKEMARTYLKQSLSC